MIDRAHLHVYQPGLLFLPFRMYGYQAQDDVVRAIEAPLPGGGGTVALHRTDTHAFRDPYSYRVEIRAPGRPSVWEELGDPDFYTYPHQVFLGEWQGKPCVHLKSGGDPVFIDLEQGRRLEHGPARGERGGGRDFSGGRRPRW